MITDDMVAFDRLQIANCGGKGGTPGPCPSGIPVAKRVDEIPVAKLAGKRRKTRRVSTKEITEMAEKAGFKLSRDRVMRKLQLKEFARSGGKRITPKKGFDPEGWRSIPTRNEEGWEEL